MKIYHQAGHRTNWNLESLNDDGVGHGIIFSPVHYSATQLNAASQEIKEKSLFDPQFYVPDSQKNKINSYHFFPEKMMNGFATKAFETVAYESAELCLEFQLENHFESLIIPTRYFPEMISDYIDQQTVFSVDPFLRAYEKLGAGKELFLTLPMTSAMMLDSEYRTNILNWITAYPEIHGVYLLVHFNEQTKQLSEYNKLSAYLNFIHELQEADLKVICGYCNTEGVLLSVLDVYGISMGAYENTRRFSIDKFLEDDQIRRGPAPRIFMPKLLNWIRWDTAEEIRDDFPDLWENIYSVTDHAESVFASEQRPHFNQPALYKHHFELMSNLYGELEGLTINDRKKMLQEKIQMAVRLYQEIKANGVILFDANCGGDHLPIWNRLLRHLPIQP